MFGNPYTLFVLELCKHCGESSPSSSQVGTHPSPVRWCEMWKTNNLYCCTFSFVRFFMTPSGDWDAEAVINIPIKHVDNWIMPAMGGGFQCLGNSNWTLCSLLSWFCHNNFPTSSSLYWGSHFLLHPKELKIKQGIHPKMDETQGFQYLGHSNWTLCSLLTDFVSNFPFFYPASHNKPFPITQRKEGRK